MYPESARWLALCCRCWTSLSLASRRSSHSAAYPGSVQGNIMTSRALRALAVAGLAAFASTAQGVIVLNNGDSRALSDIIGANNPDRKVQIGDKVFTFLTW